MGEGERLAPGCSLTPLVPGTCEQDYVFESALFDVTEVDCSLDGLFDFEIRVGCQDDDAVECPFPTAAGHQVVTVSISVQTSDLCAQVFFFFQEKIKKKMFLQARNSISESNNKK